jgi:hypothetical protein
MPRLAEGGDQRADGGRLDQIVVESKINISIKSGKLAAHCSYYFCLICISKAKFLKWFD